MFVGFRKSEEECIHSICIRDMLSHYFFDLFDSILKGLDVTQFGKTGAEELSELLKVLHLREDGGRLLLN
jgi:hypothetical protein